MSITNFEDLFLRELRDMYSSETQIIEALPQAIKVATSTDLKDALRNHLKETKEQLSRLETISDELDFKKVSGHQCEAMKGILLEMKSTTGEIEAGPTRDAAIIVMAQRVEHYEIAAYGGLVEFANQLGYSDAAELLDETKNEEGAADAKLSALAKGGMFSVGINQEAVENQEQVYRNKRKDSMKKYSKESQNKVRLAMEEMKQGKLKIGNSNKRVTSPKQAIAIGLSEARKEGATVPRNK